MQNIFLHKLESKALISKSIKKNYSNFYENVTFLRNLVNFCEFLSKRIMDRNAAA
jgi:hypothetical protein